ncbi:MAG: hypothetical protein V4505_20910 [Pseudomonadota bacterium]
MTHSSAPVPAAHFRWWLLLAGAICSLLILLPVLSHEGWPANHDFTAAALRMGALVEQWKLGHPLPVWSAREQFGHGSPLLALYHKSFLYLSGLIVWATGSAKGGIAGATWVCLVGAFCGLGQCVHRALDGRRPALALLGGALLVSSNYATTDWLVRGAFAELSAFAVLPWVFAWCITLIRKGLWGWWLGPVLALLALSHTALGLFVAIPVLLAVAVAIWRWRRGARRWLRPAAASAALGAAIVLPFALPMAALGRFNRIGELTASPGFNPMTTHLPWQKFLWDAGYHWGDTWQSMTVQLDTGLLLALPVFAVLALAAALRPGRAVPGEGAVALFLLGTLAAMAWLQSEQAFGFYQTVPGAIYLQFSWRLLAYITVALTLCACLALAWLLDRMVGRAPSAAVWAVGAMLLVSTANNKPWWSGLRYEWIAPATLQGALRQDYVAAGEFLPLVDWPRAADPVAIIDQTRNFLGHARLPAGCTLAPVGNDPTAAASSRTWRANCEHAATIALPAFAAPGMYVSLVLPGTSGWTRLPTLRTCADPRVQVALPAGSTALRIDYPGWRSTVRAVFTRPGFDFRRDCAPAPG